MSIPLPCCTRVYRPNSDVSCCENDDNEHNHKHDNIYIHDAFLTSDERYEIHQVKAAERPHLLTVDYNEPEPNTDDDDDENNVECMPIIDGCDIPGWRREKLQPIDKYSIHLLNIGPSCTMFRRERQWPINRHCPLLLKKSGVNDSNTHDYSINRMRKKTREKSRWEELLDILSKCPSSTLGEDNVQVIHYKDYCQLQPSNTLIEEKCNTSKNETRTNCMPPLATKFALDFEEKNIPVKILGVTDEWEGMSKNYQFKGTTNNCKTLNNDYFSGGHEGGWTFLNLVQRFGNVYWRFSDTHGEMMSLATYAKYITNPEGLYDDSPLAIYDSEFGDDDSPTNLLLNEYKTPECFSFDLFNYALEKCDDDNDNNNEEEERRHGFKDEKVDNVVEHDNNAEYINLKQCNNNSDDDDDDDGNDSKRPPYRWILIGPARSGTGLHIDPLYTNAWVTLLQGRKRWILFPPSTPHELIGMIKGKPQIPSSIWFSEYYELIKGNSWPQEYKPVEILQYPGETVFVPNGWPHLVLNLDLAVAVTHNYASEFGPFLEKMWRDVVENKPVFAVRWLRGLEMERPDLAKRIVKFHESAVDNEEEWALEFNKKFVER